MSAATARIKLIELEEKAKTLDGAGNLSGIERVILSESNYALQLMAMDEYDYLRSRDIKDEVEDLIEEVLFSIDDSGDDGDARVCQGCRNSNWSSEDVNHEPNCVVKVFIDGFAIIGTEKENEMITTQSDPLMDRYFDLAETQNIPSVAEYALEWQKLAANYEASGRPNTASMCRSRGDFYAAQDPGEYTRLIEGSFSTLIKVEGV